MLLPTKRRLEAEQDFANKKARIEEMEQNTRLLKAQAAAAAESWRMLEGLRRTLQYGQGEFNEQIVLAILNLSTQHVETIRQTIERRRELARPEMLMPPAEQRTVMEEKAAAPKATLLSLPRELRSQIYEYAMFRGCIHIENDDGGFRGSTHYDDCVFIGGKGLTRKLCRLSRDYDHVEARKWLNKVASDPNRLGDYETKHHDCLHDPGKSKRPLHDQGWPFALLFVCKQTFDDLRKDVYTRNSFSFRDDSVLDAFIRKIPRHNTNLVRDLRLALDLGQTRGCFVDTIDYSTSINICNAFGGLRRFHVSLKPSLCMLKDWRSTLRSNWRIAHWARFVLDFGSLPLEDASVLVVEAYASHKAVNQSISNRTRKLHRLSEDEMRKWARKIRDQLLAPWDRDSIDEFLRENHEEGTKDHKKFCIVSAWERQHRALPLPENRVP